MTLLYLSGVHLWREKDSLQGPLSVSCPVAGGVLCGQQLDPQRLQDKGADRGLQEEEDKSAAPTPQRL